MLPELTTEDEELPTVREAPEAMPWGHVVFAVTDVDGNVMRFGSVG